MLQPQTYAVDVTKVLTAILHLDESAKVWSQLILKKYWDNLIKNYILFTQELQKQFENSNLHNTLTEKLHHLHQIISVLIFINNFENLAYQIQWSKIVWGDIFYHGRKNQVKDMLIYFFGVLNWLWWAQMPGCQHQSMYPELWARIESHSQEGQCGNHNHNLCYHLCKHNFHWHHQHAADYINDLRPAWIPVTSQERLMLSCWTLPLLQWSRSYCGSVHQQERSHLFGNWIWELKKKAGSDRIEVSVLSLFSKSDPIVFTEVSLLQLHLVKPIFFYTHIFKALIVTSRSELPLI